MKEVLEISHFMGKGIFNLRVFQNWTIPGFFRIFSFFIQTTEKFLTKIVDGWIQTWSSGMGNNRSANCATTIPLNFNVTSRYSFPPILNPGLVGVEMIVGYQLFVFTNLRYYPFILKQFNFSKPVLSLASSGVAKVCK